LGGAEGAHSLGMGEAIFFSATCPQCGREQLQGSVTVADLMRLLYGGDPIEAYCSSCDALWTVSVQKRVELGDAVAAACGSASSPTPPQVKMVIH
jgi:hypothetical protein